MARRESEKVLARSQRPTRKTGVRMCPRPSTAYRSHSHAETIEDLVPSAPPIDLLEAVEGYEFLGFDAGLTWNLSVCIPPPVADQSGSSDNNHDDDDDQPPAPLSSRDTIFVVNEITEQQARAALLCHVTDHCCYGRAAARRMRIANINYSAAHHYELQTFTEKREVSWTFVPFAGGDLDGPEMGTAPQPWQIEQNPSQPFHDELLVVEVPHTASVKDCHRCRGQGSLSCAECHGKGWTRCLSCHGNGWSVDQSGYRERCYYCQASAYGDGKQDCLKCNAKGRVACPPCDSYGQVRCFIRLTISWKVNTSEHIVCQCGLPEELVRQVSGQVALEQRASSLAPLDNYPDASVLLASQQLLLQHADRFHDQRLLQQRQQVRAVPVAEICYTHKSTSGRFWVYGYENHVHAPDYPQRFCCGCCSIV